MIPAHDEEEVIGDCLSALLADARSGEFEIVVVPNGCRDRTAEIAATFGNAVQVIESPTASKTEALNVGDAALETFPRIYLDADIRLSASTARELVETLEQAGVMFVTPKLELDLNEASWGVRAYYRIWSQLPYRDHSHLGRGTIALSRDGRQRFGEFPPVLAEDLFIRRLFFSSECRSLDKGSISIRPPANLQELIRVKTRVIGANLQYRSLRLPRMDERTPSRARVFLHVIKTPSAWPDFSVYLAVTAMIRLRAHAKLRFGNIRAWERVDRAGTVRATIRRRRKDSQHGRERSPVHHARNVGLNERKD